MSDQIAPGNQLEPPPDQVVTVSRLTAQIQQLLEGNIPPLWVEGEVSNFRPAASGHMYFTLKDDKAQIQAVMFRGHAQALRFTMENGLKVICFGEVTVYAPRGQYQLKLVKLRPAGVGELQLAFEQLKAKLEAEGLFDPSRKRPLPYLPGRIGIVTSPTGAAIRDLITVLTRRFPSIEIVLAPVKVQGEGSAREIADGIARLNALTAEPPIDLLIIGRGGGSMEDLWAFNEEVVARAIAGSRLPVISAVGHEVDFTIADFVADLRAPTPSAAAETAVPERSLLLQRVKTLQRRVAGSVSRSVSRAREAIDRLLRRTLFTRPRALIETHSQRVDELTATLVAAVRRTLVVKRTQLLAAANRLEPLSPSKTLMRGYAIVTLKGSGRPLTDAFSLRRGDRIEVRLAQGQITCRVEGPSRESPGPRTGDGPGQERLPGF
ncbi:MAG: exodeoxyribonuclease VII large subunit [Candidatus Riflebacteria bacterium]|nr:exodeoxyribonuclease VII large subunit [Candidatus Riflebacteria bacterium]